MRKRVLKKVPDPELADVNEWSKTRQTQHNSNERLSIMETKLENLHENFHEDILEVKSELKSIREQMLTKNDIKLVKEILTKNGKNSEKRWVSSDKRFALMLVVILVSAVVALALFGGGLSGEFGDWKLKVGSNQEQQTMP